MPGLFKEIVIIGPPGINYMGGPFSGIPQELMETVAPPPGAARLRRADLIVAIGPFGDPILGAQIGGAIRLAVEGGSTAIVMYRGVSDGDEGLLRELVHTALVNYGGAVLPIRDYAPAFREYFTLYATGSTCSLEHQGVVDCGFFAYGTSGDDRAVPVAQECAIGRGRVYVVPYRVSGSPISAAAELAEVVSRLNSDGVGELPDDVANVQLPGEVELVERIKATEQTLDEMHADLGTLTRFKHLVANTKSDPLEQLVIETLNVVLEGRGVSAVDHKDEGKEDFWLRDGEGEGLAICEVKGAGSHVRREHVNQVDNHREDAGKHPDELPGVLIMNVLTTGTLEDKKAPVAAQVVRLARTQNVLILRTWDLLQLLVAKLGDVGDPGSELIAAVKAGGGWLEVTETGKAKRHQT